MKKATLALLIGVLVVAAAGYFKLDPNTQFQKRWDGERLVAAKLKDPSSAQFSDIKIIKVGGEPYAMCGMANGKNGFGAYAGQQRFYVTFERGDVFIEPTPEARGGQDFSNIESMLNSLCSEDSVMARANAAAHFK